MPARAIIRRTVSIAAGIGIVAVLHEFGVKYAEQMGWYDNLPSKMEAGMSWLVAIAEPVWFKVGTALMAGVAIGMWIDSVFKHKEKAAHQLSRDQLADEAETLGRRISLLAAQGAARNQIAWNDDMVAMRSMPGAQALIPRRDRTVEARAWTLEKYGELHFEAESIIARAAKCISLDQGDLWQVSHILLSGHDIERMSTFLASISSQLRYDQPNMPPAINPIALQMMQTNLSNQGSESQSRSSTEPERRP